MHAWLVAALLGQTVVPLSSNVQSRVPPSHVSVIGNAEGWLAVWDDVVRLDPRQQFVFAAQLLPRDGGVSITHALLGEGTRPWLASDGLYSYVLWRDAIGTRLSYSDGGLRFAQGTFPSQLQIVGAAGVPGLVKVFARTDGGVLAAPIVNAAILSANVTRYEDVDPDSFSVSGFDGGFVMAWVDGGLMTLPYAHSGAANAVITAPGLPPFGSIVSSNVNFTGAGSTSWLAFNVETPFFTGETNGLTYVTYARNGVLRFHQNPMMGSTALTSATVEGVLATFGTQSTALILSHNDGGLQATTKTGSFDETTPLNRLANQQAPSATWRDGGFVVVWDEWLGQNLYQPMAAILPDDGGAPNGPQVIQMVPNAGNTRLVSGSDGVFVRYRSGTGTSTNPLMSNGGTLTLATGTLRAGDRNPYAARSGGHELTFGAGGATRYDGVEVPAVGPTFGVRCVAADDTGFTFVSDAGWVTISSAGHTVVPIAQHQYQSSCATDVATGVIGTAHIRSNGSVVVALRDALSGLEMRKHELATSASEVLLTSLRSNDLLVVWRDASGVRFAIDTSAGFTNTVNVATSELYPQDLEMTTSPGGSVLVAWRALNEAAARMEVRTAIIERATLLGLLSSIRDGGSSFDGGTNSDGGHFILPDAGRPDASVLNDAGTPDAGTADAGDPASDGGMTSDAGSATDAGSMTSDAGTNDSGVASSDGGRSDAGTALADGGSSDGGVSTKPQDFEPTCGCDAGGGVGLLALLSVVMRRRQRRAHS